MIKIAQESDFAEIKRMFINFANSSPVEFLHNPEYDNNYIDTLLYSIKKVGVLLIATHKDVGVGFFIAMPAPDIWLPKVKPVLREMAWWVEPEHRAGTTGGKLFLKYLEIAKKQKSQGEISGYTMTLMDQSPDIKLDKWGFKPIETVYYAEQE